MKYEVSFKIFPLSSEIPEFVLLKEAPMDEIFRTGRNKIYSELKEK
jgi:hypothetical protein